MKGGIVRGGKGDCPQEWVKGDDAQGVEKAIYLF